ncbi:MAG: AAA-like domain-containing protein [Woeseiaceae bacterium]|nr:AAA-like domain-containing protein [Woeseiaceae bacterium]
MSAGSDDNSVTGREQTTGEFFSVGTPLHAVRAGYIKRRADDLLYESAVAGRYAHIIAPDRTGKSSLVAATQARLESQGFMIAVLDLEQIGESGKDAGRWYYNVAYRLLRQLRIRFDLQEWWQDKSILSNRQRLQEFYSEVILQNVPQRIVVFVDGIQSIEELEFADQLLASIRSAHNARTTDPEFSRLTFVLIGECDPLSLVNQPELSPFNVTQAVPLDDFSRDDLNIFATELNLDTEAAQEALDRIYYWTRGQPYLTQKLARAVSRDVDADNIDEAVDRIVMQQLAGKAALHSEPHLSHIHREIVSRPRDKEAVLNLYGRLRKGINVAADLGSAPQRRLMASGLIEVDEAGDLRIRNRIYARVFTARWANENLSGEWRTPFVVALLIVAVLVIPLWYTQWLPKSYVSVLTSEATEYSAAESAWLNLRSFPGHSATADSLYRTFLEDRAGATDDVEEIAEIASRSEQLPGSGLMPAQLLGGFWDRRTRDAVQGERRDEALLASLEALVLSTAERRNRSAMLVGEDYPLLLGSLPAGTSDGFVFNPGNMILTSTEGSMISQWSLRPQGLTRVDDWSITALEVTPLVRRVIVDRDGIVNRAGLTLNLSHPRFADLRIRIISPSGRVAELEIEREFAASNEDIRVPASQLQPLIGETLSGTWSVSIRDEATGVMGRLVGWSLTLNSQALDESFVRGLAIPDPTERETDQFWISPDGRYAVARATQSDSARLWDLAFGNPIAAIAVGENEQLIGLDAGARRLVTATFDTVSLWDTSTGKRSMTLPVGAGSESATLTTGGRHLLVQERGDTESRIVLWSLDEAEIVGELTIAGAPALVAIDTNASRIAIADYDRAVRIWELATGELLAQLDLPRQPSEIRMNASGQVLGAVFGDAGLSLTAIATPNVPLLEELGSGRWQLRFSGSGSWAIAGRSESGFQLYDTRDGRQIGPLLGIGSDLLAFSNDENVIVTESADSGVRFWTMPTATLAVATQGQEYTIWAPSGETVVAALPGASRLAVGDRAGRVHLIDANDIAGELMRESAGVSFLGHNAPVRGLAVSPDGTLVASFAADNTIRLWSADDGKPVPVRVDTSGTEIERIAFSEDSSLLAILSGVRVTVSEVATGEVAADIELGERHTALAVAANNAVYLGSESGTLNLLASDPAGEWTLRRVWTGEAAIRQLEASPTGRYLVLVDAEHRATQFNIEEGRPGGMRLELPSAVEDIAFSPGGSRVLFRTPRWVHRAGSSAAGLIWFEATLVPRALKSARIVFGDAVDRENLVGARFYLPVSGDGALRLREFRFSTAEPPTMFGNKDELIAEWRQRLARVEEAPTEPTEE